MPNNQGQDDERRKFTRIPFDAWTEIEQNGKRWNAVLIDLSLKGLLVKQPNNWTKDSKGSFEALIRLDTGVMIKMKVILAHQEEGHIGFLCESIDVDSISHLRRLIELNMGNCDILERELHSLG